jgi:hypothetical protein
MAKGCRRAGFFGGLSMTVLFACGTYGLPSAELPREFKDSVGVHCRRCGQELGTLAEVEREVMPVSRVEQALRMVSRAYELNRG